MHSRLVATLFTAHFLFTAPATAITISVDGSLADWQVDKATWKPSAAAIDSGVKYAGGDQVDPTNGKPEDLTGGLGVQVFPGWGGQIYDAEALYVHVHADTLYFAVVTGLPKTATKTVSPTTGAIIQGNGLWAPGDIAIDFGNDGSYEFGIETTGTSGAQPHGNPGDVYLVRDVSQWQADWLKTPYQSSPNDYRVSDPTSMHGGTKVGSGVLVYTSQAEMGWGQYGQDLHYIIEGSVPLTAFGDFRNENGSITDFMVHWTMDCGNDAIMVDPPGQAPEPATLALIGVGLAGIGLARRRRAV